MAVDPRQEHPVGRRLAVCPVEVDASAQMFRRSGVAVLSGQPAPLQALASTGTAPEKDRERFIGRRIAFRCRRAKVFHRARTGRGIDLHAHHERRAAEHAAERGAAVGQRDFAGRWVGGAVAIQPPLHVLLRCLRQGRLRRRAPRQHAGRQCTSPKHGIDHRPPPLLKKRAALPTDTYAGAGSEGTSSAGGGTSAPRVKRATKYIPANTAASSRPSPHQGRAIWLSP
ncbi:hypothetical protein D9M68_494270 [compost metagenome]